MFFGILDSEGERYYVMNDSLLLGEQWAGYAVPAASGWKLFLVTILARPASIESAF